MWGFSTTARPAVSPSATAASLASAPHTTWTGWARPSSAAEPADDQLITSPPPTHPTHNVDKPGRDWLP